MDLVTGKQGGHKVLTAPCSSWHRIVANVRRDDDIKEVSLRCEIVQSRNINMSVQVRDAYHGKTHVLSNFPPPVVITMTTCLLGNLKLTISAYAWKNR